MKKLLCPIQKLVIFAASVLTATLAPAQTLSTWNAASGNWSVAANWSPTGVPGAATNVMFTNNVGAAASAGAVDNTVDAGFGGIISSLQYANTNTANVGFFHTTQIAAGHTLTNAGSLTVGTLVDSLATCQVNATITGAGATLLMTNTAANLVVNQASANAGAHIAILNMTNLDNFTATIGRVQVAVANGVNRAEGNLFFAKTNNITLSGSAPQFYVGFNNGNNNGNNNFPVIYLGQANAFNLDSITISADKQGNPASRLSFNPVFTNNNPIAVFRGSSGGSSRVSAWIQGNNSGQSTTSSTSDGVVDFSYGTLDAMVDTMTLGISEKSGATGSGNGSGTFTFTAGTNNVNNLILGKGMGNAGTSVGNGTMNVNSNAVLVANNFICLSYWTAPSTAYGAGNLNINGGTVMAATITNGVFSPGSVGAVNANITMNGGTLGITSLLGSIGTTAWPLGIVTFNNAALQLPVSGLQTNVVASILNLGGTTNIISITSIPASVITYPTQFPLIAYSGSIGGTGFNIGVSNLPGSYQGFISNNVANGTIDLVMTSGPTSISTLEWKGNVNSSWDTATANWLNGASSVAYLDGAGVLFDDNATGSTAINLTANRSPVSVTISNNTLPYSFSGAGIIGGAALTKYGTGTALFTNSGNTFVGNITINAGTVQFGSGGTSGTLPSTGNILDNGNLVINRSGNVSLPNTISGTGTLTKSGTSVLTVTASNDFSGTTFVSNGTLLLNGVLSGTLTNAPGSVIGGTGTNSGAVNVGGLIQPSAVNGAPATFTSGDLNLYSGATLQFALNGPDTTVGNGSNDLLNVAGNLSANNNVIALNFAGVPQTASPYTLVNFSGGLTGSFNPTVTGTHYAATLNQASPNVITVSLSGSGANLKWNCATNNGLWDTGISTNWLNTGSSLTDLFYAGDNVVFDDSAVATNLTISSGVLVSPSSIVVNANTNNFTFNGGGQINGSGSLVKLGSSRLTINTPNHGFTGTALIAGGIVQAGNNAALVGATTTITNGATLDIHGFAYVNGPQTVTVSGAGVGGNGAIVNNGADQQNAFQNIALAGDTTMGGTGRFDMRQSGSNPLTLTSANGNPYNLTVVGPNHFNLVSVSVDGNLGNVDIKGGTFGLQVNTLVNSPGWAGDTSKTIMVESNATLSFFNLGTSSLNRAIVLSNGASLYNESGINTVGGLVSLPGNATIQVDNAGTSPTLTMSGVISGPGSLTKTGLAALTLSAANTYTGNTLLNAGTVNLLGDGAIGSSGNIVISAGSVLNASVRNDQTLTLASGQLLQGNGAVNGSLVVGAGATLSAGTNSGSTGSLTCSNNVTLQGKALMKLNPGGATNDVINVANASTINLGGALTVTNISGSSFAIGNSFRLFNAATYSGAFTSIAPATPGLGLAWNTNNLTSGVLAVVSGVVPQPGITSISLVGTSLVINGTNGVTGQQYNVLTTTNLALPLANWTVLPTNTFSAGNFSITNTVNPGAPQSFYILRVP